MWIDMEKILNLVRQRKIINKFPVYSLFPDPQNMSAADKIQSEWSRMDHVPMVSEVRSAALLAWAGYLASVEFMILRDLDISAW